MGLFDTNNKDIYLENADLDCTPQNEFVSKKSVEPIDEYLDPGEQIHYIFTGQKGLEVDGKITQKNGATRTAITDRRILIKAKTGMVGTEYQSIRYEKITGVNLKRGMLMTSLIINSSSTRYKVRLAEASGSEAEAAVGKEAVQFIRQQIDESQTTSGTKTDTGDSEDPLKKLEELGELRDKGIISEGEFEDKKEELMDRI